MPSELGRKIKERRQAREVGLRELARRIDKSASFLSMIENAEKAPPIGVDTLQAIEQELGFDTNELVTLAGKTPGDVAPSAARRVFSGFLLAWGQYSVNVPSR